MSQRIDCPRSAGGAGRSGTPKMHNLHPQACAAHLRALTIVDVDVSGVARRGACCHCGLDGLRQLVKQCSELLRREDPVALGHELPDLLPVRVVGEQHSDAITAGSSRGEEGAANGQQSLAFVWVGT
jgi:hypothetical protein